MCYVAFVHILAVLLVLLAPVTGLLDSEMAAALNGQVPVRIEPHPRADGKMAGQGVGAIVVKRPIGEVWNTLSHFEDKPEYMPRLKTLEVLEKSPERVKVKVAVDASVTTARYTLVFSLNAPQWVLSWKLDATARDNSIADAVGEYRLFELAGGQTLVTYRSYVDTGRAVPRMIQDYMAKRSIPNLLRAIQKRVESGGRWRP